MLIEAANEMARRGFKVRVLCYENKRRKEPFYPLAKNVRFSNLLKDGSTLEGREQVRLERHRRRGIPDGFPYYKKWIAENVGYIKAVRNYIERSDVDVLIPFMPPAMTAAALANFRLNARLVASTHNDPKQDFENRQKWSRNPVDVFLRRMTLRMQTTILVLLPGYKAWYPKGLRSRVRVLANPITPMSKDLLHAARREKTIISVGRLTDVKRHDLLIKAWSDLRDSFPDWRIRIYGDGPNQEQLEALINALGLQESVALMGITDAIQDEYLSSAVLAHPSEYEGFPLVVCEALAAGLPVVGFKDCSGVNTLVQDGRNGLLVNAEDRRTSFGDGLRQILADDALRERLGAAAPGSVAKYAPSAVYDKWEAVIRKAAKQPPRSPFFIAPKSRQPPLDRRQARRSGRVGRRTPREE